MASGCKKTIPTDNHVYMNDAIIIGPDYRMCPCCGGLMFSFVGAPDSLSTKNRISDDNNVLGITNETRYPFKVKLDWKASTTGSACGMHYISVIKARR